ncbi:hypothetical protein [Thermoactinomyces sp. CICC 10522]|nr:hypothetical protein [Thermoactinomyces sp. CICC 10522]MBH8603493.1 hypothetical protein [Thermoactinomyces sp. CICC 10522]
MPKESRSLEQEKKANDKPAKKQPYQEETAAGFGDKKMEGPNRPST